MTQPKFRYDVHPVPPGVFVEVVCACGHTITAQVPPDEYKETPEATAAAARERWAKRPCFPCSRTPRTRTDVTTQGDKEP
jgi:hypothetical protein